ncbi:histidine phosphatase family protein [Streptomyces sp. NPDC002004]
MTVRLTLLCAPSGNTAGVFGDGLLDERTLREAVAAAPALPPHSPAVRAPSMRCEQAAEALGLETTLELAVRDFDYGKWLGRTVDDVAATDPHGLSAWLTDPDAAPHGGESVRELCRRTAHWLGDLRAAGTGHTLAITEPTVIRAALVHALCVPARTFWHLDVPPLSAVTLTVHGDEWSTHVRPGRAADDSALGEVPPRPLRHGFGYTMMTAYQPLMPSLN